MTYVTLEALQNEIDRWRSMTEESVGEDALSDYGNDMPSLIETYEKLKKIGIEKYGEHIIDFTRG